jgi:sphinganine-1-phosphate aldolase
MCPGPPIPDLSIRFLQSIIYLLLLLPSSRAKVATELSALRKDLSAKLAPPRPHLRRDLALPEKGLSAIELEAELDQLASLGADEAKATGRGEDWKEGRVSGAVYGTRDTDEIIVKAYSK